MKKVCGKDVYDTLEEMVAPKHTAVLVVDVQNDYCSKGGAFDLIGTDLSMVDSMVPNVARLLDVARSKGVKVVFIEMTYMANGDNLSPSWLHLLTRVTHRPQMPPNEMCVEGTWGAQTIDALNRRPTETVVKKARSSAFNNTNLDQLLRSNGIETVVVTGDVTQGCVDSTARDASFYDYYVVIVRDCVGSTNRELHEAALKIQASRYDVVDSADVVAAWARA